MLVLKRKTAEMLASCVVDKFGENLLSADEIFSMLEYPPDKNM